MDSHLTRYPPAEVEVILYHDGCTDGLMAAAIGLLHHQVTVSPLDHDGKRKGEETIELVRNKKVLIVDYCPERSLLIRMQAVATWLLVLDHHKSNMEACQDLSYCHFDMTRSGCGLSWQYFYNTPMPDSVACVQDRDLWTWKLPKTKDFCAGFYAKARTIEPCLEILKCPELFSKYCDAGAAVSAHIDETVKSASLRGYQTISCSLGNIALINATEYISDLGNEMAKSIDYVLMFTYGCVDNEWLIGISIRSKPDKDCTLIATKLNGGGHRGAAGGRWNRSLAELVEYLSKL